MAIAKRVLILTADAGFGHRAAAHAVADALHEHCGADCAVTIVNPLLQQILRSLDLSHTREKRGAQEQA